ncbi:hypothetical protein B0F90DRAFT_1673038 [Multifurca ochricompacta]|uniref:Uncharacterized protein n=1 Tax=Multifurca ochricompacta TaxID=376703 RepID=A0AAD4QIE8_9AGAM|nr:hypothetical protein B0F90DRAFT_1673038 [Multifurca ochricompacta]
MTGVVESADGSRLLFLLSSLVGKKGKKGFIVDGVVWCSRCRKREGRGKEKRKEKGCTPHSGCEHLRTVGVTLSAIRSLSRGWVIIRFILLLSGSSNTSFCQEGTVICVQIWFVAILRVIGDASGYYQGVIGIVLCRVTEKEFLNGKRGVMQGTSSVSVFLFILGCQSAVSQSYIVVGFDGKEMVLMNGVVDACVVWGGMVGVRGSSATSRGVLLFEKLPRSLQSAYTALSIFATWEMIILTWVHSSGHGACNGQPIEVLGWGVNSYYLGLESQTVGNIHGPVSAYSFHTSVCKASLSDTTWEVTGSETGEIGVAWGIVPRASVFVGVKSWYRSLTGKDLGRQQCPILR